MKKSVGIAAILFLTLFLMLFHADWVTEGARHGLLLWYNSVVPALFPFMVLSSLIVASGGVSEIMEPIYRVLHPFLPVTRDGCYVLVSGLLCGCPMGAKTCADFVRDGRISLSEGRFLLAICNHPSPMFLLGYVYPFFKQKYPIWVLLACVYGPVVILAVIAKKIYFRGSKPSYDDHTSLTMKKTHTTSSIDEMILSAVEILCKIGGYLVLFSILIVFLRNSSMIPTIPRLAVTGLLEMTTGIKELASSLDTAPAFIASAATLTFGGLSGLFQTNAVIRRDERPPDLHVGMLGNEKKAGLTIRPYFFWKLAHAALAAATAFLLCIMLPEFLPELL